MNIKVSTHNCSYDKPFVTNDGESNIIITFEFERLISVQSRNSALTELIANIQQELKEFRWLICGKVQLELSWLLNAVQRQETSKVGDLDNISKPLIDCLSGPKGILIDDSQINSLHTSWITQNNLDEYSLASLKISYFNDWTVERENLYFFGCDSVMYTPINLVLGNQEDLIATKAYLETLKAQRMSFSPINMKRYLVSEYLFHRTRLSKFNNSSISNEEQCSKLFVSNGAY